MPELKWVLLGGVAGGFFVSVIFGLRKAQELRVRGALVKLSMARSGNSLETYLATQGDRLETTLERYARQETARLAESSADQYMAEVYGLTPQRMARLRQLMG